MSCEIEKSLGVILTYLGKNKINFNDFSPTVCHKIDETATAELRKDEKYSNHIAGW